MCDNRELERLREQRDDAIGRAVDAANELADITTERDALAEILHETTEELAAVIAECASLREELGASEAWRRDTALERDYEIERRKAAEAALGRGDV